MANRRAQDEGGRRTHVEDGLEIPDHLEGVTFDQKKRLARLAKMGLGPVAKGPAEKPRRAVAALSTAAAASAASAGPSEDALAHQQQQLERRAALLDRERRMRLELQRQEEEEQQRQQEEERKRQEREKAARPRAGLKSLGPVQPREERKEAPMPKPKVGYPIPASLPFLEPAKAPMPAKMEVKLFPSTVERVASSTAETQQPEEQPASKRRFQEAADPSDEEEGGNKASSSWAAARPPQPQAEKRAIQEDRKRKKAKKRRKRRDSSESGDDKLASNDDSQEEEIRQKGRAAADLEKEKRKARDGGISWHVMEVESVKGKVSTVNKGFTDADLERRFGPRETSASSGLMTEEQVLAIMRKDKKGKSDSDWAMRRAQKELAEWTAIKAQRMARGGEEKERLVVSGRAGATKIG